MRFIDLDLKEGDVAICNPTSVTNPHLQGCGPVQVKCIRSYTDSIRPSGLRLDHSTLVNNWEQYVVVEDGTLETAHLVASDWIEVI